jgi:hypothetical protein
MRTATTATTMRISGVAATAADFIYVAGLYDVNGSGHEVLTDVPLALAARILCVFSVICFICIIL